MNKNVKVVKLAQIENHEFEAAQTEEEWRKSESSPPINHTVTGNLLSDPSIGEPLMVYHEDTGEAPRVFRTSPIMKIFTFDEEVVVETVNSRYKITLAF